MGYYEEARALLPYLSTLRREFHRHPCISREELWTAERIEAELDAIGVTDHRRIDGTGVLASLKGALPGDRVMALRADTDALPIQEENDTLSYRSQQPGKMHACGHDAHTAGLLGAARLLCSHRDELSGEVRFLFQHAEEIGYGAKQFIKAGALEGVSRVFGIHMAPDLPCGKIGIRPGPNNASVDHFTIEIRGKAAHVSTPNLGVDALYIASQLVVALQALVTRRTAPVDPVIVGVGKLSAGTSYNIVAGNAVLEGTTRAFSPQTRAQVNSELEALCHSVAQAYGGSATVAWGTLPLPWSIRRISVGRRRRSPANCSAPTQSRRSGLSPAAVTTLPNTRLLSPAYTPLWAAPIGPNPTPASHSTTADSTWTRTACLSSPPSTPHTRPITSPISYEYQ